MYGVMKNRISWIDWAKAILISLVVLGHCGADQMTIDFIYAIHMPAFFIISGFLYRAHGITKTFVSLFLPVFVFSTINLFLLFFPYLQSGNIEYFPVFIKKAIISFLRVDHSSDKVLLFTGCWFIFVLFACRILLGDLYCISNLKRYSKYLICVIVLYLSIESLLFDLSSVKIYYVYKIIPSFPFVLTGYLFKDVLRPEKISLSQIGILLVIFIICTYCNGTCDIFEDLYGLNYLIFYLNAICGSILLFSLCAKLPSNNRVSIVLASSTLFILPFHIYIRNKICTIFEKFDIFHYFGDGSAWIITLLILIILYYPSLLLLKYFPKLLGK